MKRGNAVELKYIEIINVSVLTHILLNNSTRCGQCRYSSKYKMEEDTCHNAPGWPLLFFNTAM